MNQDARDLIQQRKHKRVPDNTWLGLALGLVFPIFGILLLYLFWGDGDFGLYVRSFADTASPVAMRQASKIISLSMFAMLIPFNYFLNRKKYLSTRGVIFATAFYAILIILYNFVWQ